MLRQFYTTLCTSLTLLTACTLPTALSTLVPTFAPLPAPMPIPTPSPTPTATSIPPLVLTIHWPAQVYILPPPADANTVGLWHFQERSGVTLLDSSGRGHNGTAIGNYGRSLDGKFGGYMSFDGSSSYVDLGNSSDFNLNTFTLEAWVYKLPGGPLEGGIINKTKYDGNAPTYGLFWAYDGVGVRVNGSGYLLGNTNLSNNRWYHLAATFDGSIARVYVNGSLDGSNSPGSGPTTSSYPLQIGRGDAPSKSFYGYIQGARVSNVARLSFPYGQYGRLTNEPITAAGDPIAPPITASPDLAVLSLAAYPNPTGGVLVQATVRNQGSVPTQNGFFTDLYANHLPTGAGDYTGSIHFWVASPIEAGQTVTLTTTITALSSVGGVGRSSIGAASGISSTLYAQVDSTGVVSETNNLNNISGGAEVCVASADAYESDDTAATAKPITLGTSQAHNFDSLADEDWVKFTASGGVTYTVRTDNLGPRADTYLYIYDTDGTTLLAANDDYGGSLASHLDWTAPTTGTYYLLVKH